MPGFASSTCLCGFHLDLWICPSTVAVFFAGKVCETDRWSMVTGATAGNIAQVCGACGCSLSVSRCFKLKSSWCSWMKQKPKTPKWRSLTVAFVWIFFYDLFLFFGNWLMTNKYEWILHVGPGRSWSETEILPSLRHLFLCTDHPHVHRELSDFTRFALGDFRLEWVNSKSW